MSPILNTCTRCSVQGMYGTWKYGAGTLPRSMKQVHYLELWSRYITWKYWAGTLPGSMGQVHYLEVWSRYITWNYEAGTLPGSMEQVHYLELWSRYITWKYGAGAGVRKSGQQLYSDMEQQPYPSWGRRKIGWLFWKHSEPLYLTFIKIEKNIFTHETSIQKVHGTIFRISFKEELLLGGEKIYFSDFYRFF